MNTHNINDPRPIFDPHLRFLSITPLLRNLQLLTHHINNKSSNSPSPTHPIITQISLSQIYQILLPIAFSSPNAITTQPNSQSSQTYIPTTISSSNPIPLPSLFASQNLHPNWPHSSLPPPPPPPLPPPPPSPPPPPPPPPPPTSYDPYASFQPGFHNYPPSSFQPFTLSPIPLPHSISVFPFNPHVSQPPPLVFQMTRSVLFTALSEPNKLFDHTYPPEKFLAFLNARGTFQLVPQHLDFQSCLTWHARGMSLLHCSLTGTASNWYDRPPQNYKKL